MVSESIAVSLSMRAHRQKAWGWNQEPFSNKRASNFDSSPLQYPAPYYRERTTSHGGAETCGFLPSVEQPGCHAFSPINFSRAKCIFCALSCSIFWLHVLNPYRNWSCNTATGACSISRSKLGLNLFAEVWMQLTLAMNLIILGNQLYVLLWRKFEGWILSLSI